MSSVHAEVMINDCHILVFCQSGHFSVIGKLSGLHLAYSRARRYLQTVVGIEKYYIAL